MIRNAILIALFCALVAPLQAATIVVNTLADATVADADCSLREALLAAQSNDPWQGCSAGEAGVTDTITFDPALFNFLGFATMNLSQGQLTVAGGSVAVQPPAGKFLVLVGPGNSRLMRVNQTAGNTLTLTRLTLRDGDGVSATPAGHVGWGGGMLIEGAGSVLLRECLFSSNSAEWGGAISFGGTASGTLDIEDCDFLDNTASESGGAINGYNQYRYNVAVRDSRFERNVAQGTGLSNDGGGAISLTIGNPGDGQFRSSTLVVEDSRFEDNEFTRSNNVGGGGALHMNHIGAAASLFQHFQVSVSDSVFEGNHSASYGGVISMDGNPANLDSLTVLRSAFIENHGRKGGAIWADGSVGVTINNNLFSRNTSSTAGGLFLDEDFPQVSGSVAPVTYVSGNSFHENYVATTVDGSAVRMLRNVQQGEASFHGNLVKRSPQNAASTAACFFANQGDWDIAYTLHDQPSCALGVGAISSSDLRVELETIAVGAHTQRLLPQIDSAAVDAWPTSDCRSLLSANPATDMTGVRESSGLPLDGNADGAKACDIGASEAPEPVIVTLSVSGDGRAISDPTRINCGAGYPFCTGTYRIGDSVHLYASAEPGNNFIGWGAPCAGQTDDCVFTVSGPTTITADFVPATTYGLSVDFSLGGAGIGAVSSSPSGINCPTANPDPAGCEASFAEGQIVTLTATPEPGSVFSAWFGDCTGSATTCDVSLSQARTVTARFDRTEYRLTMNYRGSGRIFDDGTLGDQPMDCGPGAPTCEIVYPVEAEPEFYNDAEPGWLFDHWEGDCSGSGACQVAMHNDLSITAVFSEIITLDVAISDGLIAQGGVVTSQPAGINCPVDCSEIYGGAPTVELTAVADSGWVFDHWEGDCTPAGNICTTAMTTSRQVAAVFQSLVEPVVFTNGFE